MNISVPSGPLHLGPRRRPQGALCRLRLMSSRQRRGSVIAIVLICLTVALGIALIMMDRSVRGRGVGAWGRDRLALRLLAESVTEELFLNANRVANNPDAPAYAQMRNLPRPLRKPVTIDGLKISWTQKEAQRLATMLGGSIDVKWTARVTRRARVFDRYPDARECSGVIELEADVTLRRLGRPTLDESVIAERSFRVSRVTPPLALSHAALMVRRPTRDDLSTIVGRVAYATAAHGARALVDLMTHVDPDSFRAASKRHREWIRRSVRSMSPALMERRAQYVVSSPSDLSLLIAAAGRSGRGSLSGVVHMQGKTHVHLELPDFKGRLLLSFRGPVEVGDIHLDNPARDSLTIVTPDRITIVGARVEANLVNTARDSDGIVFMREASIKGCVCTNRFPRSVGISAQELGNCKFEAAAPLRESGCYVVALAPYPSGMRHLRDGREWHE